MPKKYLVTGGAGFIGSHIASRLIQDGHRVLVIDNLSTGYQKNLPREAEFLKVDISGAKFIEKLPRSNFDAVLHLAAQSSGEESHYQPQADLLTNTLGTLNLLRWCESRKIPRFLYASSMAVYGNPDHLPVTEEQPCHPLSYYGITKLAAEGYVQAFERRGLKTTIFRMFSVYGPGQDLGNLRQGIVSIYLAYMLKKKPIVVKGALHRFRDLIFIDDVVDAWVRSIDLENTFGKIYNLGRGEKVLVSEIISEEAKILGHANGDYPIEKGEPTLGDQFGMLADVSRLRIDLKWKPSHNLHAGLKRMIEWAVQESNQ